MRGPALPGLSRALFDRHEPPRPAGAVRVMNAPRRLGLRAGLHAAGRPGSAAARARPAAVSAWRASRRWRSSTSLGFTPAIRPLLHQRADDARPGRHSPGGRGAHGMADPLVMAGGPGAANPEPMARFIDAFVLGDGEEALPAVCDLWLEMRHGGLDRDGGAGPHGRPAARTSTCRGSTSRSTTPTAGRRACGRLRDDRAAERSSRPWCDDLDAAPLPSAPIVPLRRVRARADRHRDHARLSVAMPLLPEPTPSSGRVRFRRVETIVAAALRAYRATGHQRSRPAGALDERLSADRRAADAAPCRLPAAGREHLDAQPAGQRRAGGRSATCWTPIAATA